MNHFPPTSLDAVEDMAPVTAESIERSNPVNPPELGPVNAKWFCDRPEPILDTTVHPLEDGTPDILTKELFELERTPDPQPTLVPETSFVHQRIASSRVPEDNSHVKLAELANMLDRELNGLRRWNVPGSVEHTFPDEILGIPVSKLAPQIVKRCEKKRIMANGALTIKPDELDEVHTALFLNKAARRLASVLEYFSGNGELRSEPPKIRREWSSGWYNRKLSGSSVYRKPDLVLLDVPDSKSPSSTSEKISWAEVHACGEVTKAVYFNSRLKDTLDAKTYIQFLTQHDRIFVPTIAFFGPFFIFSVTDRESQQFGRILMPCSKDHPEDVIEFFRILLGLMFSPDHVLGRDATMTRNRKHVIESILVEGEQYEVIKLLYSVQSMLGRATKVWEVKHKGKTYVLKDSWVIASRPHESDVLRDLKRKGVIGVPQIVAGGAVEHVFPDAGVPLRTSLFRPSVLSHHLGARERRRIVEGPQAQPLSSFETRLEIFVAFRDYVEALEAMATAGWVHRDISYNNLMLYTPSDDCPAKRYSDTQSTRRGTIVDLDYTSKMDTIGDGIQGSYGGRTGTAPYMALSILIKNGKDVLHTPQHDLESLFYVLLTIFTTTEGPGKLRDIKTLETSIPLITWYNSVDSYRKLGQAKQVHLIAFEDYILKNFTHYWRPLGSVAHKILKAIYPNGLASFSPEPKAQHKHILAILNTAISFLGRSSDDTIFPQIATVPSTKRSSSYGPPATRDGPIYPKRPRSPAAPRKKSTKRLASKGKSKEEPMKKTPQRGKKRSMSRIDGASEDSVPKKRSRGGRISRGPSTRTSTSTSVILDESSATSLRRSSRNQSSVSHTQTVSVDSPYASSSSVAESSTNRRRRGRK